MSSIQSMKRFTPGDFEELKSSYFPSMIHVNQHTTDTHVGAFVLQISGVRSLHDATEVVYKLLIDLRNFPTIPHAYVLTPSCQDIHHLNVAVNRSFSVAPGMQICWICPGKSFTKDWEKNWQHAGGDSNAKIKRFLEQIDHVLNNPNPDDPAREV